MTLRSLMTGSMLLISVIGMPLNSPAELSLYHAHAQGGINARLLFEETPLVTMRSIPFVLVVKAADDQHLGGLSFNCSLTMPAMPMPPNSPETKEKNYGYVGRAIFTMEGAWRATFSATANGMAPFKLVFDIPKVLLK